MELWVAFGFGAAVGALVGYLLGRRKQVPLAVARPAPPSQPPPSSKPSTPSNVKHVLLDEGSANVLNALNNRLAAIGALADLLHGSPLDPERARALVLLHGEVRRAAEITSHFLELAAHPAGAPGPAPGCCVGAGGGPPRGKNPEPLPRARGPPRRRRRALRCGGRVQRGAGRARIHVPRIGREADALRAGRSADGRVPHGAADGDVDEAARLLAAAAD